MPGLRPKSILLVHPLGYQAEAAGGDVARVANSMPPLGLACLAAYLEQHDLAADIIDCFTWPQADRRIADYLRERRPAFVGFSCTTSGFLDAVRLAELAKQVLPGVRTVFGGPHVSALRETLLERFPAADYLVAGEGERPLRALLESDGGAPADIPGLVYRDADGTVRFTGVQDAALDLDSLPFPAYDKLPGFPRAYPLPIFSYPRTPNTSCITSRGCPYQCSYCDRSVFGRSYRYNSADYMAEHVALLQRQYGVRHINFYDDQFTLNRARLEGFAEGLARRNLDITFNCAARAEHLDADLLRVMKRAGCWMISLGIETGDPQLLAQHRQNPDLDMLAGQVRLIRQVGMRVKGLVMMGLPGESLASIRRSRDYVMGLKLDDLNVAKFTPFPGTPIYREAHELGEFDEDWSRMDCLSFQFVPKGLTRAELDAEFLAFYKAYYRQPRVLFGYLTMLWRSPDSWRRFLVHAGTFLRFAGRGQRLAPGSGPVREGRTPR